MIIQAIYDLTLYGIEKKLIEKSDETYIINSLLGLFNINEFSYDDVNKNAVNYDLESILNDFLKYAIANNIIEDNIVAKDLFDTKIMSVLCAKPSEIIKKFNNEYEISPKNATDYFFNLCGDVDYIRKYRIKKDLKWKYNCDYGNIDITINLSKPEKDPKTIAALKNAVASGYPKCVLCKENEGYFGRLNHPARQTLRLIPLNLCDESWSMQYSPYVYYNEHCIVLENKHTPMLVNKRTIALLIDFIKIFPHYFIGSNAGLPIVGGSILCHNHFQGGRYKFAMEEAPIKTKFTIKGFEDVECGIVKWPMSVIRIKSKDDKKIIDTAGYIMDKWSEYSDEEVGIFAKTNEENHNAITPIARKNGDFYEVDLVLRNNRTTADRPMGLFHPRESLHHIKKENIGLIEVMGLAVLPSRLKNEIEEMKNSILNHNAINENSIIYKHKDWIEDFTSKRKITAENIDDILKKEIGKCFVEVLKDAGVFKTDQKGEEAFMKFINKL